MRANNKCFIHFITLISLFIFLNGCNKLVQISPPTNTVGAATVFSTDQTAQLSVIAIYDYMRAGGALFNAGATIYTGQSSDELDNGRGLSNQFSSNTLTKDNATPSSAFWKPAYYYIFMANAVIEGLAASSAITPATRNQLTGEARFLRAFSYFYLVNLFGDVPLVLSSDFNQTALLPRTPKDQVYQQIISDLVSAKNSLSNGERIRANKWTATALLARTYLYLKQWDSAATQASAVINSGFYQLLDSNSLNNISLIDNSEAIFQLQTVNASPWATAEGSFFIRPNGVAPTFYIDSQLINAFEVGDKRKDAWVNSTTFRGVTYYYPYKYKVRAATPAGNITEYYVLLRLAEQYLIRAEAEAQLNNLGAAIDDLNAIRARTGLPNLALNLTQEQVLAAVMQERRIELFAECGHRWLDLKRTGQAVSVLSQIPLKSGHINENQLLYPIPQTELLTDPNLAQNPGY